LALKNIKTRLLDIRTDKAFSITTFQKVKPMQVKHLQPFECLLIHVSWERSLCESVVGDSIITQSQLGHSMMLDKIKEEVPTN
jgi:hypothetical protein